jgi:heavy metal sensor kinase
MSLTTRLSIFFLAALAIVLVGFSTILYGLAHLYLKQKADERLTAALDTLEAAVDREPDGLDWDATEERVSFMGREPGLEAIRWQVSGGGKRLDKSRNLISAELESLLATGVKEFDRGTLVADAGKQPWQVSWRQVTAEYVLASGKSIEPPRHPVLVLTAAVSLQPMQATLLRLVLALAGVSTGVWLTAAVAGRWVCRRALAPVAGMAKVASEMGPPDVGRRLPDPKTRDELAELCNAFNGLLDRLQMAFERQQRFTGDASHQLRTPLTAMLGQVEVALRRGRSPVEYRQTLALVQGQIDHLRQMVEALLFLARADAEAELALLEPIDLAVWLPKQLDTWKDRPRAGDLRIDCDGAARVRAQPVLLGQLLDNLLDNALKYSEPGMEVKISLKHEADAVALTVQDAGQGIGPDDLPHIFEAFYRGGEARRQGKAGVGLGLATAQRIAGALHGTLRVESEIGHGTRFTLRLVEYKASGAA